MQLKRNIMSVESIEKYIAIKNGRIVKHLSKWKRIEVVDQQESAFVEQYVSNM